MAHRKTGSVFYIVGGLLFILAGLVWYLGITMEIPLGIIMIVAGGAIVVAGIAGVKASPGAVAVFIIGLILFGVALSGVGPATGRTYGPYQASMDVFTGSSLAIEATASVGSIHLNFTDDSSLFYRITFAASGFPFRQMGQPEPEVTNRTEGGVYMLSARASSESIYISLGDVPTRNITLTTSMGSISVDVPERAGVRYVLLRTTTGSIDGALRSDQLSQFKADATTGSVDLELTVDDITANATVNLSTTTGSVDLQLDLADAYGCRVAASTSLGSTSINMPDLINVSSESVRKVAETEHFSTATRILTVEASTNLGSVSIGE